MTVAFAPVRDRGVDREELLAFLNREPLPVPPLPAPDPGPGAGLGRSGPVQRQWRGRGLGVVVLRALTAEVFERFPDVTRFEGQTRQDNVAMRKTMLRCGFLKEGHRSAPR